MGFGGALVFSRRLSLATVSKDVPSFKAHVYLESCIYIVAPSKLGISSAIVEIHLPPPLTLTLPTPVFVMLMCTGQACAKPTPPEKLLNNVL